MDDTQGSIGRQTAWSGLSLRFRIAGGVLAGLLVLFTFFGLLALHTINLATSVALEERLRLARLSAESVDLLIAHTTRQLEQMAGLVSLEAEEEPQVRRLHDVLGEFERTVRLSAEGGVLWTVPNLAGDAAWAFGEDSAVQAALGRAETSVVAPPRGIPAPGLIAILVTPLRKGDTSTGFLAAELRPSQGDIDLLSLPQGEGFVRSEIVDAAGYIVASFGQAGPEYPRAHVEALAPMIASKRPGTTIHHPEDGADHVMAYHPFRSLPGGVVVEQTQDAALVIPRDMERTMLVYGVGALVIAAVAAWLHADSVMRPIRRLTDDAARMASGELESPIAVSRDDEIGGLARRFDEMRVKLKTSIEERARWADELERRVAERTREVEERNRELDGLNRVRRQLLAKTISAQEDERKRLARELHDESAQTLTAALMTLKTAEDALPAGPEAEAARGALTRSRSQLEMALREIRKAVIDLRPSILDDLGLPAAVRWHADQHLRSRGIEVSFAISGEERRASASAATAIFRIVQEAVSNVARHSGARQVQIGLDFGEAVIEAVVQDDGRGFDPESLRQPQEDGRGLGLLGMRERAELFGGTVEISSDAGSGTRVQVRVPYA